MGKPGRSRSRRKIMGNSNGSMSKLVLNKSESESNTATTAESTNHGTHETVPVPVTGVDVDIDDDINIDTKNEESEPGPSNKDESKKPIPIIDKKEENNDANLTKSVSDLAITLSPYDLVWARCQGGYYWPGIYRRILEEKDGMGSNNVAVQFCEKLMRVSFYDFSALIPLNTNYEEQLSSIFNIHQKIKKKWKPDAKYEDSLRYFQQFREIGPSEREDLVGKIFQESQDQKKEKKLQRQMSLANNEDVKINKEVIKEKEESTPQKKRHSKSYKLRPSVKKPEVLESSNWNKAKNDNTTTTTAAEDNSDSGDLNNGDGQIAQVNRKTGRPYDGEELELFVQDYFQKLDKNVKFDKLGKLHCSKCFKEIESSDAEFCHDAPYHKICLNEVISPVPVTNEVLESSDEGKKRPPKFKCDDCFSKVCFLCKSIDPIDQPWDGIPVTKEKDDIAKCSKCELHFHRKCLLGLSYGCQVQGTKGSITCPRHFCQTCFCDSIYKKYRGTKLASKQANKCVNCLNSYHKSCVPAGSKMLQKDCIICPSHSTGEALDIIERRRHIGCIICFKKIKATDLFISCNRCPLYFHEACYGYTEEVKNSGISKDDFCQDYICEFCQTHPYPTFGQVVWFHQPGSSIWPAMIVYPQEVPLTIKDIVKDFCFTIKYLGPQSQYYNFVTPSATLPFSSKTLEWVEKVGLGSTNKRAYTSAVEEATFLLKFFENYRDSILPEGSATFKSMEKNLIRVPESIVPKIAEHKEHYKTGQKCSCNKDYPKNPCTEESSCVNRLSYFECSDVVCDAESNCQNRFTGKNKELESKLEVFLTPSKGYGVRAKRLIKADENIGEYIGEVITNREALNRISMRKIKTSYVLQLDNKCSIDAEFFGNTSRFINHSCHPNCIASIVANVNGKKVALLRSLVDIEEGTELTFSYGKSVNFNCNCGAPKCVSKFKPSESWNIFCDICGDGGTLLLCEFSECHKSYHLDCLKYDATPKGKWYCSNHPQMKQKQKRKSSVVPHTSKNVAVAVSTSTSVLETKIDKINITINEKKDDIELPTSENGHIHGENDTSSSNKARSRRSNDLKSKKASKITTPTTTTVKIRSSLREKSLSTATISEMLEDLDTVEKEKSHLTKDTHGELPTTSENGQIYEENNTDSSNKARSRRSNDMRSKKSSKITTPTAVKIRSSLPEKSSLSKATIDAISEMFKDLDTVEKEKSHLTKDTQGEVPTTSENGQIYDENDTDSSNKARSRRSNDMRSPKKVNKITTPATVKIRSSLREKSTSTITITEDLDKVEKEKSHSLTTKDDAQGELSTIENGHSTVENNTEGIKRRSRRQSKERQSKKVNNSYTNDGVSIKRRNNFLESMEVTKKYENIEKDKSRSLTTKDDTQAQGELSTIENGHSYVEKTVENSKTSKNRKSHKDVISSNTTVAASVKNRSLLRKSLEATNTHMFEECNTTVNKEKAANDVQTTNSKNEKVESDAKEKPSSNKTKPLRNGKESINGIGIMDRGGIVYSTRKSKSIGKKDAVNSIINEINLINGIEPSPSEMIAEEDEVPVALPIIPATDNGNENSKDSSSSQVKFEKSRQQTRSLTTSTNATSSNGRNATNKRKRESTTPSTQISNRSKRIKTSLKFIENNSKTATQEVVVVIDIESAGRDVFERKNSVNKTPINLVIRNRRLRMNERRSAKLTTSTSDDVHSEAVPITDSETATTTTTTITNPVLEEIENEMDMSSN